jgi:hypothetical protein
MNTRSVIANALGWLFGALVVAIGLINTFWGNDPFSAFLSCWLPVFIFRR